MMTGNGLHGTLNYTPEYPRVSTILSVATAPDKLADDVMESHLPKSKPYFHAASPSMNNTVNTTTGSLESSNVVKSEPLIEAGMISAFLKDATNHGNGHVTIQQIWEDGFAEPISEDREHRIQQAVTFMKAADMAHSMNAGATKYSIRQVAQHFKVPKSTLYDRLRLKQSVSVADKDFSGNMDSSPASTEVNNDSHEGPTNKIQHDVLISKNILPFTTGSVAQPQSNNYIKHENQMKMSVNEELRMLSQIKELSYTYGNLFGRKQILEHINEETGGKLDLGSSWLKSFLQRHSGVVLYGPPEGFCKIKVSSLHMAKNNYNLLCKCFVKQVQFLSETSWRGRNIYYIARSSLHDRGQSSVFSCFELSLVNHSFKLVTTPKVLLFQDYRGRKLKNANDSEPVSPIINGKFSGDEVQNQLCDTLLKCISACIQREYSVSAATDGEEQTKTYHLLKVLYEQFHWDITTCKEISKTATFMSAPWQSQILGGLAVEAVENELQEKVQTLSGGSTDTGILQFEIKDNINKITLAKIAKLFVGLFELPLGRPEENVSISLGGSTVSKVEQKADPVEKSGKPPNVISMSRYDFLQGDPIAIPNEVSSLDVLQSQLSEISELIEENESRFYTNIQHGSTRELLRLLLNRVKRLAQGP
ncbi:uncharacterized protein KNAG_0A05840 [Huiozyma naganishii CBS 8797]|uniref:Uncharacterized protein n=1 Tax=Huiozyma naganishii (strain ATCC MYA-139 / BCRC 22969 / CBS 8797 / KCTC 17520 / NBRC 10181 / NCYC 3082 / Yp74L-3) TaxID=1071383 RepID=J7RTY3_HUIN7|nr:hypothetical protein KNAG_0A05840 [Kazachstania naganishii CBS 8797]CCK68247.1 hypothetical protein KNAG_0A05840 [Kazachstania naganishii CBS 8797]